MKRILVLLAPALALAACNSSSEEATEEVVTAAQTTLSPEEQAAAEEDFRQRLAEVTKPGEASMMAHSAPTPELKQLAKDRAEELFKGES